MELYDPMYRSKKNFHQLIWPQELVVRSPGNSEDVWKGLPDIGKKMFKLSQKPPFFGDIYTYKPIWLQQDLNERECHSMCIRRVSIEEMTIF